MSATCENAATAKEWLEAVAIWADDQYERAKRAGATDEAEMYDEGRAMAEDAASALTGSYLVDMTER